LARTSVAPKFSIAAILLPRRSTSYWLMQLMYCRLRRMSSAALSSMRRRSCEDISVLMLTLEQ
jgi:hypothetical protein